MKEESDGFPYTEVAFFALVFFILALNYLADWNAEENRKAFESVEARNKYFDERYALLVGFCEGKNMTLSEKYEVIEGKGECFSLVNGSVFVKPFRRVNGTFYFEVRGV